jgi:hypothetical protein
MRRECWVNKKVPMQEEELASYLGIDGVEIKACLTPRVLSFFIDRANFLICAELEQYREMLIERHQKMAIGGQKGGEVTQKKHKLSKATLEATVNPLSRDEVGRAENQSLEKGITDQEMNDWVGAYESGSDVPTSYMKASKGSYSSPIFE